MVHQSILAAHEAVALAKHLTEHSYDCEFYPDWVADVADEVETEIDSKKIDFTFVPSKLEEQLRQAIEDMLISENIQFSIEDRDQMETERSLMAGRW